MRLHSVDLSFISWGTLTIRDFTIRDKTISLFSLLLIITISPIFARKYIQGGSSLIVHLVKSASVMSKIVFIIG